jgi:glycerophosphoryl diester phosphodiesterase
MFFTFKNYPIIIAHRGARSLAPENTLPAAQKSLDFGADAWEIDVQLTADGVPVVIHDETLSRTSDVQKKAAFSQRKPWLVYMFSLAELRTLDFGSWFAESDPFGQIAAGCLSEKDLHFGKLPVLLLKDALAFTRDMNFKINVEIKDLSGLPGDGAVVEKVLALVKASDMSDQVLISSFKYDYLWQSKSLCPEISTAVLTEIPRPDPVGLLRELDAQACHSLADIIRPVQISLLREKGFYVNIWTVNDPAAARAYAEAGATGIFTDFPQLLNRSIF